MKSSNLTSSSNAETALVSPPPAAGAPSSTWLASASLNIVPELTTSILNLLSGATSATSTQVIENKSVAPEENENIELSPVVTFAGDLSSDFIAPLIFQVLSNQLNTINSIDGEYKRLVKELIKAAIEDKEEQATTVDIPSPTAKDEKKETVDQSTDTKQKSPMSMWYDFTEQVSETYNSVAEQASETYNNVTDLIEEKKKAISDTINDSTASMASALITPAYLAEKLTKIEQFISGPKTKNSIKRIVSRATTAEQNNISEAVKALTQHMTEIATKEALETGQVDSDTLLKKIANDKKTPALISALIQALKSDEKLIIPIKEMIRDLISNMFSEGLVEPMLASFLVKKLEEDFEKLSALTKDEVELKITKSLSTLNTETETDEQQNGSSVRPLDKISGADGTQPLSSIKNLTDDDSATTSHPPSSAEQKDSEFSTKKAKAIEQLQTLTKDLLTQDNIDTKTSAIMESIEGNQCDNELTTLVSLSSKINYSHNIVKSINANIKYSTGYYLFKDDQWNVYIASPNGNKTIQLKSETVKQHQEFLNQQLEALKTNAYTGITLPTNLSAAIEEAQGEPDIVFSAEKKVMFLKAILQNDVVKEKICKHSGSVLNQTATDILDNQLSNQTINDTGVKSLLAWAEVALGKKLAAKIGTQYGTSSATITAAEQLKASVFSPSSKEASNEKTIIASLFKKIKANSETEKENIKQLSNGIISTTVAQLKTGDYDDGMKKLFKADYLTQHPRATKIEADDNAAAKLMSLKKIIGSDLKMTWLIKPIIELAIDAFIDSITGKSYLRKAALNRTLRLAAKNIPGLEITEEMEAIIRIINEYVENGILAQSVDYNDPVEAYSYTLNCFTRNISNNANQETLKFSLAQLVERAKMYLNNVPQSHRATSGNNQGETNDLDKETPSQTASNILTNISDDCQYFIENEAKIKEMIDNQKICYCENFFEKLNACKKNLETYHNDLTGYVSKQDKFINYLEKRETAELPFLTWISFFFFALITTVEKEQEKKQSAVNIDESLGKILSNTSDISNEPKESFHKQFEKATALEGDIKTLTSNIKGKQTGGFVHRLFSSSEKTKHSLLKELTHIESALSSGR